MATKTISVDLEAYSRLKKARRENESFSDAIKRIVRPPFDFKAWLKLVRSNLLSDEAVRAIEKQVAHRRNRSNRER